MLRSLMLPDSWRVLLQTCRPAFRRCSTFSLFMLLATGLVAQTARRTVVGMLAGAGMAAAVSFHSVCRLFSHHTWAADQLGLALARLFKRWGRKVHAAFWTHDGAAQGPTKVGRGNRWVLAGIVVTLPFCSHPVCLPALLRLWGGKGSATPVQLAAELLGLLAAEFCDRTIHAVGDAAYHGKPLRVAGTTWTTRLPANAALFGLAPPHTGKRGRPRLQPAPARGRTDRAVQLRRLQPGDRLVRQLRLPPDDITSRLAAQPWYHHKTEPAFEDMLIKLRRTLIATRITGVGAAQSDPDKFRDYALACAATAA